MHYGQSLAYPPAYFIYKTNGCRMKSGTGSPNQHFLVSFVLGLTVPTKFEAQKLKHQFAPNSFIKQRRVNDIQFDLRKA
jgi:hypothetical protein